MRDNAKLCIFLQPFSPLFTFLIVTHPRPPHTPLSSGCQLDRVCVVGVSVSLHARVCVCVCVCVCVNGWGRELSTLPYSTPRTSTAPNLAVSHLWLEVGMGASCRKL